MLRVFLNDVCNKTLTLPKHGYPFYSKASIRTALTEYISQRPQNWLATCTVTKAWNFLGVSFRAQPWRMPLQGYSIVARHARSEEMICSERCVARRSNAIAREVFIKLPEKNVLFFIIDCRTRGLAKIAAEDEIRWFGMMCNSWTNCLLILDTLGGISSGGACVRRATSSSIKLSMLLRAA